MQQLGQAGFSDINENKKASDIYIEVELTNIGGIQLTLEAQFATLFGRHIRQAILEQLSAMQVEHAMVKAQDFGALDFMIRARVKSAVDQARGVIS
ncbi:citrate lyase subunit gamma [Entomospira culicis]|uniref:Citrate lyase acyl carrier protein n=1 Tax=Entomospira culicis TaxID=2719989 RepID=A0A968GK86_9SPIO|nr:citrate lyase subunit gamma [Entomospira culicis]NIZ19171.1 citrate lyase acyl carrier protein [Entomospira culicis]NIZ69385.1 citrate lyase acyl carrier protein [Entomospira culicis]WDI36502.1 citrate lyase subunit gamma [Entomospira culicis]WDI38128.1 citrate lyase subunit gamma [Entomospira culicis]